MWSLGLGDFLRCKLFLFPLDINKLLIGLFVCKHGVFSLFAANILITTNILQLLATLHYWCPVKCLVITLIHNRLDIELGIWRAKVET